MGIEKLRELKLKLGDGQRLSAEDKALVGSLIEKLESENSNERLLQAVAKISTILLQNPDLNKSLYKIFEILGEAIRVDRIYYFKNNTTGSGELTTSQKVEWIQGEAVPQIDNPDLQNIPAEEVSDFITPLSQQQPFIAIVSQLEEGNLKSLLSSQDILSILVLPVFVNDKFDGFIGLDDCTTERKWKQSKISVLQTLCSQIAITIEKKEIEQLLEKTYRLAGIGTWEMDLQNDDYYWSPITKEIFEVEPDITPDSELAKKMFKDEETRQMILQDVDKTIETGVPYSREIEVRTAKGNDKWIRDTGQAHFENGKCIRLIGTVQDIDKRKKAEIESEKNKKLLDSITAQTDVAIWVRTYDGTHLFANKEWKRVFGLEDQNIVGKSIFDLVEDEIANRIIEYDRKALDQNEQLLYEERVKTINGYRYYMVNKFPIMGLNGDECVVGGIGTDITEVKKTEKKLQFAEQRLREIVEHSTNLFYKHNNQLKLSYISPQAEEFLGLKPIKGQYQWSDFVSDHPSNKEAMKRKMAAIETGNPQPAYELQIKKEDGSFIWVEVNEAPIGKNGKTVSVVGSLTNITDRKLVQDEIEKSLKEKETLLIEIHHRVKNNLAIVASLMQFQALSTESNQLQSELSQCVLRIKSMAAIHEQLYQSKNFSNLNFANNLKRLTENIISTMNFDADIETVFDLDEVLLNVNQAITCSLIVNEVITNAIKHAFEGRESGRIDISCREKDGRIILTIKDNGVGVPEDLLSADSQSVGMQLIELMIDQLNAVYVYKPIENGSLFRIEFTIES